MDAQTSLLQQYEDPQEVQSNLNKDLKQKSQRQSNYKHRLSRRLWKTLHRCITIVSVTACAHQLNR
jgi:hypothetical protein